jgi:hypothetical protein
VNRTSNTGLDWTGLDWTGLDWTGLDWTGLDWTGLDWTGLGYIIGASYYRMYKSMSNTPFQVN